MTDVKATTAKSPSPAPRGNAGKPKNSSHFWINLIIVIACIVVGYTLFYQVLGNPDNFIDAER